MPSTDLGTPSRHNVHFVAAVVIFSESRVTGCFQTLINSLIPGQSQLPGPVYLFVKEERCHHLDWGMD